MSRWRRYWNALCSIKRIFRCCKRETFLPLTNCGGVNTDHRPRTIVTWNVQGLFYFMNEEKGMNIVNMLLRMTHADIICLQEVFENSLKESIIYKLKDTHPYYLLGNTEKRYLFGEDSGLLVLSKYPIEFVKELILDEYYFPDRLANKSMLFFKVGDLNLMNTHLQSNNMFDNSDISTKQLQYMKDECPFDRCIFVGDLNNMQAYQHLGLRKNNIVRTWGKDEILDYILPWNYDDLLHVRNTSVPNIDISNVSDHYPLWCQF